jgi:methyl-accepting chemotaxis protein
MASLAGYAGDASVLVSTVPAAPVSNLPSLLWPVLGATLLGLLLVVIAGNMVAAYISRPISELEEGLLTVINGKTDLRFELEHEELGGLVFRINSLLNSLTGVTEQDSDTPPENGES